MARLQVGVLGCGAIAQIQYLPLLRELRDRYEIAALSDLSASVMRALGAEHGVPEERQYIDSAEMVASNLDAVIVCHSGPHAGPSIAAARAGKHVLVEKPMCATRAEGEAMVAAADAAGVVMMVAYMKRHDPAYRYAAERVAGMADVRFVQVNHLHPDNGLHLRRFPLVQPDDLPAGAGKALEAAWRPLIAEALGVPEDAIPPHERTAFWWVLNSMIHDLGNLGGLFGPPERVVASELWADGNGITATLAYAAGFRAAVTWVDLPELQAFEETLAVYGSRGRVIVRFPTGFSIGLPTEVTLHGMDDDGQPHETRLSWTDNPFREELVHFADCVERRVQPSTPARDAVADVALAAEIVVAARRGA